MLLQKDNTVWLNREFSTAIKLDGQHFVMEVDVGAFAGNTSIDNSLTISKCKKNLTFVENCFISAIKDCQP